MCKFKVICGIVNAFPLGQSEIVKMNKGYKKDLDSNLNIVPRVQKYCNMHNDCCVKNL